MVCTVKRLSHPDLELFASLLAELDFVQPTPAS
jgi:hypothetical protein